MAHVTFIHGISNQPEPATLLEQWRIALLGDDGIDLAALGVSLSMVYCADVLYPRLRRPVRRRSRMRWNWNRESTGRPPI